MTKEFIYSIRDIFSKADGSVLQATRTERFYIGPYQRSYKWKCGGEYDQVPQLVNDILEAMKSGLESEYFLQYITVKADVLGLEVIDGQQRLTTLSLLFYQLGDILGPDKNISQDMVHYSRYDDVNIFDVILEYCTGCDEADPGSFLEQDKYYMAAASLYLRKRLLKLKDSHELDDFCKYLLDNVKIIVNIESNFVNSEDIFANLNDNHVPLTDAYLIKGLLLTNAVNRVNAYGRTLEYTEIQEKRRNLGRIWDDIQTWITHSEHSHFFFRHSSIGRNYSNAYAMEYLLELALHSLYPEERSNVIDDYTKRHLELYNRFNNRIRSCDEAVRMIDRIRHIYRKMVTVFEGPLYNLYGFYQFSKSSDEDKKTLVLDFLDKSDPDLRTYLKERLKKVIPDLSDPSHVDGGYATFRYKSKNPPLTDLLLSFSVFLPFKADDGFRFSFYDYETSQWSFEHISPQNPKGSITIPPYAKSYVLRDIEVRMEKSTGDARETLEGIKASIRNDAKIEVDHIGFLFDSDVDEHSMGNMALLTRKDNSANNNNPFMIKKLIIQDKKSKGAFIPNHTYDVFNKILIAQDEEKPFTPEVFTWTQKDVEAHIEWMVAKNKEIMDWLNNLGNEDRTL